MYNQGTYDEGSSRDAEENLKALRQMLLERYSDCESLSDTIRHADEQQLYMLMKILAVQNGGSFAGGVGTVWDQVQYNHKLVKATDVDQCPKCAKYFWKKRLLEYCTHCGTQL